MSSTAWSTLRSGIPSHMKSQYLAEANDEPPSPMLTLVTHRGGGGLWAYPPCRALPALLAWFLHLFGGYLRPRSRHLHRVERVP